MRKELKIIVSKLRREYSLLEHIESSDFVLGVSFIFSVYSLRNHSKRMGKIETMKQLSSELDIMGTLFPRLYNSFLIIEKNLSKSIFREIASFFELKRNYTEVNSWVYQYLKKDVEREVFKKSLSIGGKTEGLEILPATQFFTEEYMTEFLVLESFKAIDIESLLKVRVLDPACGGGNFLMAAFDYLFQEYRRRGVFRTNEECVNYLISNQIFGYDLDSDLVEIAKVGLYIKACEYSAPVDFLFNLFGGNSENLEGFLNNSYNRNLKRLPNTDIGLKNLFKQLNKKEDKLVILTNPPFMGPRDMDPVLRNYIQNKYPESKGDLCVAFMVRCLELLNSDDVFGVVSQSSWMYLSSFTAFRSILLNKDVIKTCADLGTDSFYDLGGAKSNVNLTVFKREGIKDEMSKFFNLRHLKYAIKSDTIKKRRFKNSDCFNVHQKDFNRNKNKEILYLFSGTIKKKFELLQSYREFGNPMQGTSTGDNSIFVKYAWEEPNNKDWVLVSKGGGYCKWEGLNYFKVKWGKNAEMIKLNSGSAIRNLDKISSTQLVYSDTGTLGLNVRVLLPDQVFIASGPGIQVLKGDMYSHLAYLNSRIATFFLKIFSPKLTTSAGYIGKIPMNEELSSSPYLATLGKECVSLKRDYLRNKIINYEFSHLEYNNIRHLDKYLSDQIQFDFDTELKRLVCESKIETKVREILKFSSTEIDEIEHIVGRHACQIKENDFEEDIEFMDEMIADMIDVNCVFSSRRTKGYRMGCDGLIEYLSLNYNCHPKNVTNFLIENIELLYFTRRKYLEDLLHKIVLYESGYIGFKEVGNVRGGMNIKRRLESKYSNIIEGALKYGIIIDDWFPEEFNKHHTKSFMDKPIVSFIRKTDKITAEF